MKSLRAPVWIIDGYKKTIKDTESKIEEFRKAGYYGLIPEQNIILESLKNTLNSLIELDQNTK